MSAITANTVFNELMSRQALANAISNPQGKVDVWKECGYPTEVTIYDYYLAWKRNGIARRVIGIHADETWKQEPKVYENEDPDVNTPFEVEWEALCKRRNIYSQLGKADKLSGIGQFGILLLGIGDGGALEEPVADYQAPDPSGKAAPSEATHELLWVRPLSQRHVKIVEVETDHTNERYLKPVSYSVELADPSGKAFSATVHWHRVFHLADGTDENETHGTPRLEDVWNYLLDLGKVAGGSAQMFWQGALPGISFKLDAGVEGIDTSAIREELEAYTSGLQRYLALVGAEAKSLSPQVADPSNQVDMTLGLIAATKAIPKRILLGSERGELASNQDSEAWDERIVDRRLNYAKPDILIPFIQHLIAVRVLVAPAGDLEVDWLPPSSLSEQEQAEIADKRVTALVKYMSGGVANFIPLLIFLTSFLGMELEEAEMIVEESEKLLEDYLKKQEDLARGALEDENADEEGAEGSTGGQRTAGGDQEEPDDEEA